MKKIVLTLILLLVPFMVNAAELKRITLKWTDTNEDVRDILKYDDYYIIFGTKSVAKYEKNSKRIIHKYNFEDNYYEYVEKDGKFYVFENNVIHVLNSNLQKITKINVEYARPLYFEYKNGVYRYFGTMGSSSGTSQGSGIIHYYEFDENYHEIKHQYFNTGYSVSLTGYDNNNVFYFRQLYISNGNETVRRYKYDGEFSEIEGDAPSNLTKYEMFPINSHIVEPNDDVSQTEYETIENKYQRKLGSDSTLRLKIERDGTNYVALVTEFVESNPPVYTDETLMFLDKNHNIKWQETIPSDGLYSYNQCTGKDYDSRINIYDGNILVATTKNKTQVLKVYNREGKLTNDLSGDINALVNSSKYSPYYLSLDGESLFAIYLIPNLACGTKNENKFLLPTFLADEQDDLVNTPKSLIMYFIAEYNIDKKVNGEGTVEVNLDKASAGEIVEINVTPKEGYVLGEMKVIDAEGNIIPVVNGKFVMPSSNVTIEVTFVPINPNTNSFLTYLVLVLSGISFVLIILLPQHKNKVV